MNEALSIKEAAEYLNLSYQTVFHHRYQWGFFKMKGSRLWRVHKTTLDQNRETLNNVSRLCVQVGDKTMEKQKCRSEKIKAASGKLTLPHRTASEFDAVVKRLTKN